MDKRVNGRAETESAAEAVGGGEDCAVRVGPAGEIASSIPPEIG
ncbi:hypothetical protein [Planomonospora sp. ID82291]|nr:hypothetical protein [Planomonospora sp. ID82291]